MEIQPGIFNDGWRSGGDDYAARPKVCDYETQSRIEDAVRDLLAMVGFDASGETVTQLVLPSYSDDFPASIEAAVIRYSYSSENGIFTEGVWPAVKVPKN